MTAPDIREVIAVILRYAATADDQQLYGALMAQIHEREALARAARQIGGA